MTNEQAANAPERNQPHGRTEREQRIWESVFAAEFVHELEFKSRVKFSGQWFTALAKMDGCSAVEAANRAIECYRNNYSET